MAKFIARARANPKEGKLLAWYAAGAAFKAGLAIEACPFDADAEADLRDQWLWYYAIQAKAARRETAAQPAAEFCRSTRRKPATPKADRTPIKTTSSAYAEQLGVEASEES